MLETKREALADAVEDGAALLAVCGGYQLLGHSYQLGEQRIARARARRPRDGARAGSAADRQRRDRGRPRATARACSPASRTTAGVPTSARAPSRSAGSSSGFGNNGRDGLEGVRRLNLIGTYLHGPLLPKNAWLADWLMSRRSSANGARPELAPLGDELEGAAHESALNAARG